MGILDKVKEMKLVEQEVDPAEQHRELEAYAENMWHWLRTTLDKACDEYQHEGREDLLRECLAGDAYSQVKEFLDSMRAQSMIWAYPKEKRNEFILQLNSIVEDTYTVTEYFRDYSYVERYQGSQKVDVVHSDGSQKALRAVIVADSEAYRIVQVAVISEPGM